MNDTPAGGHMTRAAVPRFLVQVATAEEVKGVKRPHGKDMICTYFLGDNNM